MRAEPLLGRAGAAEARPQRSGRQPAAERGALAERLERLGVRSKSDLPFLLPLRYEDRTRVSSIGALEPGRPALIEGEVQLAQVVYRGRRQLLVRLADGSGSLTLRFFYFSAAQRERLVRGALLRCHGEVRRAATGLELVHPEYRHVRALGEPLPQTLTPIYPSTAGLSQGRLRAMIGRALVDLQRQGIPELLPQALLARLRLPNLGGALQLLHRPPLGTPLEELAAGSHPAQRRLAFEELLAHQLSLLELRQRTRREAAAALTDAAGLERRLLAALPFTLTGAQRRAIADVDADLGAPEPMARLVQGDVGCGKTAVAAAAAARAIGSGAQAALMAPTELLAEQHARLLARWFAPLDVAVTLLAGSQRAGARRSALAAAASGNAQLCVGTHALFQQGMRFRRLGLVIIDEQHRFGVEQRLALRAKGAGSDDGGQSGAGAGPWPHQLIMSATPIPRTLAMTLYADLDVSIIDELPPGRTPIRTVVVPEHRRAQIIARIDQACAAGRQAYWVCPLIEESEELDCRAAEATAATLGEALARRRVGLLHSRMPARQKHAVMQRFAAGQIELLVATTVVEVGVDVPNASLMVIENAERMGLAQLHQLRGRVGRGPHASSCVLLYRAPLSPMARARLAALRDTSDGFLIARHDLRLRGPGELLGRRQTGIAQLRIADLARDVGMLPQVRRAAHWLLARYPERVAPLTARWIGEGERYGRVG